MEHPVADFAPPPPARRRTPVWLFALLQIPYGVSGAFTAATIGRILKLAHVDSATIESTIAASVLVAGIQFLWAPTVDVRLRRRSWYLIMAWTGAALLGAAMMMPLPSRVGAFIALTLAAQVAICLTSACLGGLIVTTVPDEQRGRASGFFNFGNIGVGTLAGGVSLQLLEAHSLPVVGIAVAALTALPSLLVLFVDEPAPPRRTARELFGTMAREVWATLRQRRGWSGVLLCLSPVGTAAAGQLFTSFADAYGVSDRWVTLTNGYLGGAIQGGACLVGGLLCDRVNRRVAYLAAGVATAICATAMALGPMTQTTYVVGALVYMLVTGFCYAAFTAFVLEVVGPAGATASTQYTLFSSAGNFAISYVIKCEGWGRQAWQAHASAATGPRGILFADAALNLVGVAVFVGVLSVLRRERSAIPGRASASSAP